MHVIRLREPWESFVPASDSVGRVGFRRRFGKPTGLATGDAVHLVIEGISASSNLRLNGESLAMTSDEGRLQGDITSSLAVRNVLEIEVPLDGAEARPSVWMGEARLEIRDGS